MADEYTLAENVDDRASFVAYVNALIIDLENNPKEWANTSLESFLDAMARWTEDIEKYYIIPTNQYLKTLIGKQLHKF